MGQVSTGATWPIVWMYTIVSGSIPDTTIQSWDRLAVIVDGASGTRNFGQDDQFRVSVVLTACYIYCSMGSDFFLNF